MSISALVTYVNCSLTVVGEVLAQNEIVVYNCLDFAFRKSFFNLFYLFRTLRDIIVAIVKS